MKNSRRDFIKKSLIATAGVTLGLNSWANSRDKETSSVLASTLPNSFAKEPFSISIFSKNLHWLGYDEMALFAAKLGFDCIDLTVRPNGHVLPERVAEDLPKAVDAAKKAGLKVIMLATAITDADDPFTENILKTASSLGIRHYRMGWLHYNDTISVEENINQIKNRLKKLALLNKKYSIYGEYQNHSGIDASGVYFGGAIWDLHEVLKEINSPWLGSQYDVYHATVEGANTWPVGLKLISPYIKTIDIKDFKWSNSSGKWTNESVPLGEGLVDFKKYFNMLKQLNITCPISIHYEYPLGGAEKGEKTVTIKSDEIFLAMSKDITALKSYLKSAGLV